LNHPLGDLGVTYVLYLRVVHGSNYFDPNSTHQMTDLAQPNPNHGENLDSGPSATHNPIKSMAISVDEFSECKKF